MNIGKGKSKGIKGVMGGTAIERKHNQKNGYVILIVIVTIALIVWVYMLGKKAEETVTVAMIAQPVYKNQVITEDVLKPYEMLVGEYEKYTIVNDAGQKKRRIILWDEVGQIINSFAGYPLQQDTYAEYRAFIKSRVDNSDTVLYSFPGKEIVPLEIGSSELQAYKTFLQPGDRLNVDAVFSQKETVLEDDGYGGTVRNNVETFKTEKVFQDIMIADLLNQDGASILDIYSTYRERTVFQQAQLDANEAFKESTEPKSLLVALTPEEKDRYYYYLSKSQIKFRVSIPQRVE